MRKEKSVEHEFLILLLTLVLNLPPPPKALPIRAQGICQPLEGRGGGVIIRIIAEVLLCREGMMTNRSNLNGVIMK